jgi:Raf kinase inhibitor-like YbhB/YbcL family protein
MPVSVAAPRPDTAGPEWYKQLMAGFALRSAAFEPGGAIPRRHTCEGDDSSPPLTWSEPPDGTRSLALIVDDPDAPMGTFTHWVAWGIDPSAGGLGEGESPPFAGRNDFGSLGWRGPCPPKGHGRHRYFFRLHALDGDPTGVERGAAKEELEGALAGHVLAVAELVGTYER